MRTKDFYWFVVAVLGTSALACSVDTGTGAVDGAIMECDGSASTDQGCEGSQPPGDDSAVDEDEQAPDAADDASDEDVVDAMQVDEADEVDENVEVDGSVDEGPELDATVDETDAALDAEIEDPLDCLDYGCGSYGTCDDSVSPAMCDCVVGYGDEGGGCVWAGEGATGGIVDSDLSDAAAWDGERVVFADGVARFDSAGAGAACELGILEQTLQMPLRADSQAFVIELDLLSSCTSTDAEACPPLQVELGSSTTRLVTDGAPGAGTTPVARKVKACLGDAGYGADVKLGVRPGLAYQRGELPLACETAQWPAIDRIAIRPAGAGECAATNALTGNLSSSAGWSLAGSTIASNELSIASGGRAQTELSIASARAGQALYVQFERANELVDVRLDGLTWARLDARYNTGLCVPAWAHGGSHRLELVPVAGGVTVTALAVMSAAACGDNRFDEGFDRIGIGSSWTTSEGPVVLGDGASGKQAVLDSSMALLGATRFPARSQSSWRLAAKVGRYTATATETASIDFALDTTSGEMSNLGNPGSRTVCFPDAWEHQLATLRLDIVLTPIPPSTTLSMRLDDIGIFSVDPASCE